MFAVLTLSSRAVVCAPAPDEQFESWTAKVQSTYIWQKKPAFDAPYSGQNSLVANREKSYTFTTTAYVGARPWAGGEVYFNPEVTQGAAFSNLAGLAGFTNGEVTKVSGTNPKVYRQRLFLRQTWNLGGDREQIESDLNQMAGMVDKNRFVLTVGNFSTLDVFDDSAYAKDPRAQFMNWSNWAYAAFDYAADARGYGWGLAGEWYQGDWVVRFGRMTGPREPNGLPIDHQIGRHYGDQVELEHAHSWRGLPGKVRLLAWRNRANLASFRDALNYGLANPNDPDRQWIFKARNGEKIKYGYGVNVEQALSSNVGAFLRAMNTDGRTETYAFTEVDASLSAGVSIKGGAWGRAKDVVGAALARNMLGADRRNYLAGGGISFFIGDGALRYAPETIFETYYSWNVWKAVGLTLDYQRVQNPAYNADRGPVNFIALRLHAEF
jgi:high affinity Mn2+ porin